MFEIPLLDVRDGGPLAHTAQRLEAAHAIIDTCFSPIYPACRPLLAPLDRVASRWFKKTASIYVDELEKVMELVGRRGVASLNISYMIACTASGVVEEGAPMMRRVVDWPLPGFGHYVAAALQTGKRGDFYNISWPGTIGVLTAMAPERFCAAFNQAPMRRRTRGRFGLTLDMAVNMGRLISRETGWPPDHLLRYVFETCANFEEAVEVLLRERMTSPAIFTLTGTRPEEIALVERTEREARLFRGSVTAANDWQTPVRGWAGRFGYRDNVERKATLAGVPAGGPLFGWLIPPVLSHRTCLAVEMSAAGDGRLVVRGYGPVARGETPRVLTSDFDLRHAQGGS